VHVILTPPRGRKILVLASNRTARASPQRIHKAAGATPLEKLPALPFRPEFFQYRFHFGAAFIQPVDCPP